MFAGAGGDLGSTPRPWNPNSSTRQGHHEGLSGICYSQAQSSRGPRIVAFDSSRELLTASELFAAVREMRMPPVRKFKEWRGLRALGGSVLAASVSVSKRSLLASSSTSAFPSLPFPSDPSLRRLLHCSLYVPMLLEVSFHDLQRPSFFLLFEWVGRFTFACYSDASGVMTLDEFKCAVHKMIDARRHWVMQTRHFAL